MNFSVATNATANLVVDNHTGNKVTYNWTCGDGDDNSTDIKAQSHVFRQAGVYFVQLTVYNKISSASSNVRTLSSSLS